MAKISNKSKWLQERLAIYKMQTFHLDKVKLLSKNECALCCHGFHFSTEQQGFKSISTPPQTSLSSQSPWWRSQSLGWAQTPGRPQSPQWWAVSAASLSRKNTEKQVSGCVCVCRQQGKEKKTLARHWDELVFYFPSLHLTSFLIGKVQLNIFDLKSLQRFQRAELS